MKDVFAIELVFFFGQASNTPSVGFAEVWGSVGLREAELRFLLLFPEKEEHG
jgi:hypothetical protein